MPADDDKLWELLGKSRLPAVSPFFSRNVLRSIRQESPDGDFRGTRFSPAAFFKLNRSLHRWLWPLSIAGASAVFALTTLAPNSFVRHRHQASVQSGPALQIVGNPDYEVIKHLDELVADEESSLWLDDSVHSVN